MNAALRTSAAHFAVDDLADPVLDEAGNHHLRVVRLGDGDLVTVTDGLGRWRQCRVVAGLLEPAGEIIEEAESSVGIRLWCALPKQQRPEWIVQKATELGVAEITWLECDRSVVRWDERRRRHQLERHQRIAIEAALQSRRVRFPVVAGPIASRSILGTAGVVVADPDGRPIGPDDRKIAIGPEGGWSPGELEVPGDRVSLGPQVLRVETAAVAAVAIAMSGVLR